MATDTARPPSMEPGEAKELTPEQAEEAKLKAKYPALGHQQRPGGSDFLRKRLQKGPKYFDSGDYNMALAKTKKVPIRGNGARLQQPNPKEVTGDTIPTPDNVPARKPSLQTSKLVSDQPQITKPEAVVGLKKGDGDAGEEKKDEEKPEGLSTENQENQEQHS
ncbi:cAMP-regulated phosphoprotein 19-like [Branchiostoma floridae]|uniref:cAMP-regulated phosphoprotein 19-like n=1 Tax=Branchiostoma floridae TaxID=7739 RepID=C3Y264_BRAFL|nr:cAMP-regulated phosphoprotein 19-like [Branchiostoma floridae]|eukprot:XP_002609944.1 hypothetical protein BRAFLDRAFT_124375 [Branchiostoma floridae]